MLQSWHTVTSAASTGPKPVTGHPRFEKWGVEERSCKATLRRAWTRVGGIKTRPSWQPTALAPSQVSGAGLPLSPYARPTEGWNGRVLQPPCPLLFLEFARFFPPQCLSESSVSHHLHVSSVIASLRSLLQLPYLKVSLSIFLLHHPPIFLSWHLSPCRIIRISPSSRK